MSAAARSPTAIGGNIHAAFSQCCYKYSRRGIVLDTIIFGKQISLIGSTMGSHQDFHDVMKLLRSGKLKPVIHCVMPLSEGREAYQMMESGEQFGKIVLTP